VPRLYRFGQEAGNSLTVTEASYLGDQATIAEAIAAVAGQANRN